MNANLSDFGLATSSHIQKTCTGCRPGTQSWQTSSFWGRAQDCVGGHRCVDNSLSSREAVKELGHSLTANRGSGIDLTRLGAGGKIKGSLFWFLRTSGVSAGQRRGGCSIRGDRETKAWCFRLGVQHGKSPEGGGDMAPHPAVGPGLQEGWGSS